MLEQLETCTPQLQVELEWDISFLKIFHTNVERCQQEDTQLEALGLTDSSKRKGSQIPKIEIIINYEIFVLEDSMIMNTNSFLLSK